MKGILAYHDHDPEMINSIEGWSIRPLDSKKFYTYLLTEESDKQVRMRFEKGLLKSGEEFEYEVFADCYVDTERDVVVHSAKAKIIFEKENVQKLFLIDIDGTICDDIKNEDSHLYKDAKVIEGSLEQINKWAEEGHIITFFTAREEKDRYVTLEWLWKHGFKFNELIMNKPRINDGQEYVWIDNKKVRAVTYLGNWTGLKEVDAKIQVFG